MSVASNSTSLVNESALPHRRINTDSLAMGVLFAVSLTVVQRGVGFLRGLLFCRGMTETELGQWSMVFSFLMLMAPLVVMGLPGSFGRFADYYLKRGQMGGFVRRTATLGAMVTAAFALSLYTAPRWYSQILFGTRDCSKLVQAMAFTIVFVTASNFLGSLVESLRQIRLVTWMRFIQSIVFATLGLSLIHLWTEDAVAATIAFAVACFLSSLPAVWFLISHRAELAYSEQPLPHSDLWNRIAPFALWVWATNLVSNMFEVSDRYMLVHWSNFAAEQSLGLVGQYHSSRVIPMLLVSMSLIVEAMLLPYMTPLWEANQREETGRHVNLALKLLSVTYTITCLIVVLFAPFLFEIVLQGKYADGLAVLPLTMVYSIWLSINFVAHTWLWVAEKGKYIFLLTCCGLFLNLFLNALLIPTWGLWGAVAATSVASFCCLFLNNVFAALFGFAVGHRIWLASLLPLVLLLPADWFAAVAITLVAVVWKTTWIFDAAEKQLAESMLQSQLAKIVSNLFPGGKR